MYVVEKQKIVNLSSEIIILFISLTICIPLTAHAIMTEASDKELSEISAQSGINYVVGDSQLRLTYDSYSISDTDHTPAHRMEFNNFTIDDGQGGYFSLDTPAEDIIPMTLFNYNTIDVATDDYGQTFVVMNSSTNVSPRTYTIGNFVFCDQDLGSLRLENVRHDVDTVAFGSHADGGCGIDMEYQTKIDIDSITYRYNFNSLPNFPNSLVLSGLHLCQYATGSPEDPTSWSYAGKFKFGDLANDNPITIDVGTSDENGTSVFMNIPMSGTARVENVEFNKQDFGPVAIDGINVHHLGIQLPGN